MREKRRHQRLEFSERITAVDSMSGEPVGVIGNLSSSGLMLICDEPMEDDLLLQLDLDLPDDTDTRTVSVGVHTLWSHAANAGRRHWVGFEIVDISSEDEAYLESLVVS